MSENKTKNGVNLGSVFKGLPFPSVITSFQDKLQIPY